MRKSKAKLLWKLRKSIPAIKTLKETIRVFSATCTSFQERLLRPRCSVINHKYICVCLVDLTSSSRVWFCKTQKEPWVIGPSLVASSSPLKICFLMEDRAKETTSRIRKKTDSRWPIQFFSLLHDTKLSCLAFTPMQPICWSLEFPKKIGGGGGLEKFLVSCFLFFNLTPPDS